MTDLMAKYFYDKSITFYTNKRKESKDGGRGEIVKENKNSIICNIHEVTAEIVYKTFGLNIDAKLLVTCSINETVENGFKFDHQGHTYEVVEKLNDDSHLKILCK